MMSHSLILYTSDDGLTNIQLQIKDGTVWLNQDEIADIFQKGRSTIAEHIHHILDEGELTQSSVCRNFRQTASDGKTYEIQHYNLDMILAVGYRVRSPRGTQFRKWATTTLKEYLIKGFVMNDERLKNPGNMDYFEELLERIREIRASEKLFYQKVKDIYIKSVDYDSTSEQAQVFFKTVQNKMLYAVTGMTAAELIKRRSDPALPHMGLTTWKNSGSGRPVRKGDVITAKNYLQEEELSELNRVVTMFLDTAEDTARQRKLMHMKDWEDRLNEFLRFTGRNVLKNAGSVSHSHAEKLAYDRYEIFDQKRREQEKIAAEHEASEELKILAAAEDKALAIKHSSKKNKS